MEKIVKCPRCNGSGLIHDRILGFCTFGISTLFECLDENLKDECPRCEGSGFLKLS